MPANLIRANNPALFRKKQTGEENLYVQINGTYRTRNYSTK